MPTVSWSAAGIYVHVPFCSAICPYCDFAVLVGNARKRQDYVATLIREIQLRAESIDRLGAVDTIYFGGGTPSLLEREQLQVLFETLASTAHLTDDCRVFFEANPEDVTPARLANLHALGVDTLTLGVQALDDDALAFLGRRHRAQEARQAIRLARDAGFETVSFDLMYGLPGQDATAWRQTLDQAVALAPDHLSCYQLTIESRTPFDRAVRERAWHPADERTQAELFRLTHEHLRACGYLAYEVSNFARHPRHRSRHNQKYWHHVPYVGVGPAAHSFDGRERAWNERHLAHWQRHVQAGRIPIAGSESIDRRALALEMVMLGLRTTDGIDLARCQRRLGFDITADVGRRLAEWVADGLLIREAGRLRPTLDGLAVADTLASEWKLPEDEQCLTETDA